MCDVHRRDEAQVGDGPLAKEAAVVLKESGRPWCSHLRQVSEFYAF